jgi:hypothetical protein
MGGNNFLGSPVRKSTSPPKSECTRFVHLRGYFLWGYSREALNRWRARGRLIHPGQLIQPRAVLTAVPRDSADHIPSARSLGAARALVMHLATRSRQGGRGGKTWGTRATDSAGGWPPTARRLWLDAYRRYPPPHSAGWRGRRGVGHPRQEGTPEPRGWARPQAMAALARRPLEGAREGRLFVLPWRHDGLLTPLGWPGRAALGPPLVLARISTPPTPRWGPGARTARGGGLNQSARDWHSEVSV